MVKFYAYDASDIASRVKFMLYKDDTRKCVVLSINPTRVEDLGNGLVSESIRLMGGVRAALEPMARLNAKRLNQIADDVRRHVRAGSGEWFNLYAEAIAGTSFTPAADPFTEPAAQLVA